MRPFDAILTGNRKAKEGHVVYNILVTMLDGGSWEVMHRFNDFDALYLAMVDGGEISRSQAESIGMPKKGVSVNREKRQQGLNNFVSWILDRQFLGASTQKGLLNFFQIPNRYTTTDGKAGYLWSIR
jgi:hypothetical protein